MAAVLRIILIAIAIQMAYGHLTFKGQCPAVTLQSDFDVDRYLGRWRFYAKYPGPEMATSRCYFSNYGKNFLRNQVGITNGAVDNETGETFFTSGFANTAGPSQWEVILDNRPSTYQSNYDILSTDYTSYSVVTDCTNVDESHYIMDVYVLYRGRDAPSADVVNTALNVLTANGIDTTLLQPVVQTNCLPV